MTNFINKHNLHSFRDFGKINAVHMEHGETNITIKTKREGRYQYTVYVIGEKTGDSILYSTKANGLDEAWDALNKWIGFFSMYGYTIQSLDVKNRR